MSTDWSESNFSDHILDVFDYYNIEYQTEVPLRDLGDSTGSQRKIDIYIPKTDTAIELKGAKGDLEGDSVKPLITPEYVKKQSSCLMVKLRTSIDKIFTGPAKSHRQSTSRW